MIGVEVALTFLGRKDFLEDHLEIPIVELDSNGLRQCRRERIATLITQDYLLLLLVLGLILGIANRDIHRNHNEVFYSLMLLTSTIFFSGKHPSDVTEALQLLPR